MQVGGLHANLPAAAAADDDDDDDDESGHARCTGRTPCQRF